MILIKTPVGVTIKKNTIPITIGDINLPKNNPNLNQILFSGVRISEFNRPNKIKIRQIIKDQTLISSLLINGYKAIIKKTTKKTNPKDLLDGNLVSSFFSIIEFS
tara:strand:+ start:85 stop:399 length:315 start_codon:yes stop_codon:yes gene_type:complete